MKVDLEEWDRCSHTIGYIGSEGSSGAATIVVCECGSLPAWQSVDTTYTPDAVEFGPRRKFRLQCRCGNATTVWAASTDGEAIDGAVAEWNLAYGLQIEPDKKRGE